MTAPVPAIETHPTIDGLRRQASALGIECRMLVSEAYYLGQLDGINKMAEASKAVLSLTAPPAPSFPALAVSNNPGARR